MIDYQHYTNQTQIKVKEYDRLSNITLTLTQIKVKEYNRLSNITLRHKLK